MYAVQKRSHGRGFLFSHVGLLVACAAKKGKENEKNISAKQDTPRAQTWFSGAHGHSRRAGRYQAPQGKGAQAPGPIANAFPGLSSLPAHSQAPGFFPHIRLGTETAQRSFYSVRPFSAGAGAESRHSGIKKSGKRCGAQPRKAASA